MKRSSDIFIGWHQPTRMRLFDRLACISAALSLLSRSLSLVLSLASARDLVVDIGRRRGNGDSFSAPPVFGGVRGGMCIVPSHHPVNDALP
jgi:hypothetical protein